MDPLANLTQSDAFFWKAARALIRLALIAGTPALLWMGVTGGPANDWAYVFVWPAVAAVICCFPLIGLRLAIWQEARAARRQEAEEERLIEWAVSRGYDREESRAEIEAAKVRVAEARAAKQRSSEGEGEESLDAVEEWRDRYFDASFVYSRNPVKLAIIAAEEGLVFAPIAYFDLGWPAAAALVTAWALAHYPVKSLRECALTGVTGGISVWLVLPHGIFVHALSHFMVDYIVAASMRAGDRLSHGPEEDDELLEDEDPVTAGTLDLLDAGRAANE